MTLDPRIETIISTQIAAQFPEFYREEGPLFVLFVRKYYEWLESDDQVLHHSRRELDYKDVDATADRFLVSFKEKYLSGVQLQTETDTRRLIKHALDLYRSKGSDQAIELLFRLVFNKPASVYRPAQDIFRLSDGSWNETAYLEVNPRGFPLSRLADKTIVGLRTGSRGFVQRVVRKRISSKYVNVLYVTSLTGEFKPGEVINLTRDPLPARECPIVLGSLSSLEVDDGGSGYRIGDVVSITSDQGVQGRARVSEVSDENGRVKADLLYGGYGYTVNAEVLVSDAVLTVESLPGGTGDYFSVFDQVTQKMASVVYVGKTGGSFQPGDGIKTYDGLGSVRGSAYVASVSETNSSSGALYLSVVSGNVEGGRWYTDGNVVSANQDVGGYAETIVAANVIAMANTVLIMNGNPGFSIGEKVTMGSASATVVAKSGSNVSVTDVRGRFNPGHAVTGSQTGATLGLLDVSARVGLIDANGIFVGGDWVYATRGPMAFRVRSVSSGSGFSAAVSELSLTETIDLNLDRIRDYANVRLNALSYGFPASETANAGALIGPSLNTLPHEVGRIDSIRVTGVGVGYTAPPLIRVLERLTYDLKKPGFDLELTGSTGKFAPGEIVIQTGTGARGEVRQANSSWVSMSRLSVKADFVETSNATTRIVGTTSGFVANVVHVFQGERDAMATTSMGLDAATTTSASTATGVVRKMEVIDSGLGYIDDLPVNFSGSGMPGTATAGVAGVGHGGGYYSTQGGFPSSTKKLFDGDYYQGFSYEVRTSVTLDRYREMLARVVHMAGMKPFWRYYSEALVDSPVAITSGIRIS